MHNNYHRHERHTAQISSFGFAINFNGRQPAPAGFITLRYSEYLLYIEVYIKLMYTQHTHLAMYSACICKKKARTAVVVRCVAESFVENVIGSMSGRVRERERAKQTERDSAACVYVDVVYIVW